MFCLSELVDLRTCTPSEYILSNIAATFHNITNETPFFMSSWQLRIILRKLQNFYWTENWMKVAAEEDNMYGPLSDLNHTSMYVLWAVFCA